MPNESVLYHTENNVAYITLNRPDRYNSVNHDLTLGLLQGLDNAKFDSSVRAVVLRGADPGFSAGADLKSMNIQSAAEVVEYIPMYYGSIVKKIMHLDVPVIAAIHGAVSGVSLAFALACDLRIMAEDAVLRYPFINIGLGPDGGAGWLIVRAVGYSKAYEIVTSGDKISAQECHRLGLCNRIAPPASIMEEAQKWAEQLAQKAPIAMAITKRDLHHAVSHSLYENTIYEAENQAKCLVSKDFSEGVMAFIQKRKPKFEGK